MHWSNGKFHKDVTVGGTLYTTDHKHVGIYGTKDYTQFGEPSVHSYLQGKDVGVVADNKFFADSKAGSNLWSKKYIHIEAGSDSPSYTSTNGSGLEFVSKNGEAIFRAEGHAATVKSTSYVNLNGGTGITINNSSYGNTLPTTGNVEGRVYFKLIS